jgi:hypothetical protein
MTTGTAVLACWIALGPVSALGQALPEIARLYGGSANPTIDMCATISRPGDLMSQADLVVHGRVTSVTVGLNADQSAVITEYTIAPIQTFKPRRTDAVGLPGMVSRIDVTLRSLIVNAYGIQGFQLAGGPGWIGSDQMPKGLAGGDPARIKGVKIDPNGASLFTAPREQLGLELQSTKGPVGVLVIDHVEHPIED